MSDFGKKVFKKNSISKDPHLPEAAGAGKSIE